jgi:hypothetical protein
MLDSRREKPMAEEQKTPTKPTKLPEKRTTDTSKIPDRDPKKLDKNA